VLAGLMLSSRGRAVPRGLVQPSVDEILAATNATRSRAYEVKAQIDALLQTLARPPGRPRVERPPAPAMDPSLVGLLAEVFDYVVQHPGCVQGGQRVRYSDEYRQFVLELRERHADVAAAAFAAAIRLPLGTLEDWLRCARPATVAAAAAPPSAAPSADEPAAAERNAQQAQIETVLAAWRVWRGGFGAFCDHVRRAHRIELGRTLIANILFAHGARTPARRGGRSRDEDALRGTFETFFGGAQWVGDGKQVAVVLDGRRFHFNLELVVDAATDAAVGIRVRDEEDSAAVTEAFEHGVTTTGAPPLALLLDNRPSNHTPEVDAALGDTMRIRATPGRAQNKAHVEGSFGLFAQKVPPLVLDTRDPRTLASTLLQLLATTFFCALNRAPRRDRGGKTRVDLYGQSITPEHLAAARAALCERMRKQELARQTRAARLDPAMRALLDDAFARLDLLDPERHFRDAIACYPRDAIVDAIAIFDGKRRAGTLPEGVDARYLLGIVKNVHHVHQAEPITEALIRERLAARDRFLEPLVLERDALLAAHRDVGVTLVALVDRLVRAERTLDQCLWLDAAAALVAPCEHDQRIALARRAARRVHAAFRLAPHDRDRLERSLLRRLWPLE
jgi:hypothetical protein